MGPTSCHIFSHTQPSCLAKLARDAACPALGNLVEAGIALYYSLCSILEDVKLWNRHPFSVTVGLNIRVSIMPSCFASDSAHSSPHLPIESRPALCSSICHPCCRHHVEDWCDPAMGAHRGFVTLTKSRYKPIRLLTCLCTCKLCSILFGQSNF
jgi:hypothetical protein